METFEMISSIATAASAIFAAIALLHTCKSARRTEENERKSRTIEAYMKLQQEVLDPLVHFSKKDAELIVENMNENEKSKDAYDDARTMLARCECFAVALQEEVYDFRILYEISGNHLQHVYKKIEPILIAVRGRAGDEKPYEAFENLCDRIDQEYRKEKQRHETDRL